MKKFKEQYPDHMACSNESYVMNKIPDKLLNSLPGIYVEGAQRKITNYPGPGYLDRDTVMKIIVNKVAVYSYNEATQNWGWDYLIQDLKTNVFALKELPFARFMDSISDLALNSLGIYILDDLNELFEFVNFGYRLNNNHNKPWNIVNPNTKSSIEIETVAELTRKLCKQTADHILQAKEQLKRNENSRARKDAIRDCLSAMEALMKHITNSKDVKGANILMLDNLEMWGPKFIITEGHKLWKLFHEDYTDIRHGNFDISNITIEEANYFIERILIYVSYISTIALKELN